MKTNHLLAILLFGMFAPLSGQVPITIPMHRLGNLIVVEAEVDGKRGNFIIDTGVKDLILNEKYFRGSGKIERFRHILSDIDRVAIRYCTLKIAGHRLKNVYAKVLGLSLVEAEKQVPIHGLIGTHLLRRFEVLIDAARGELTLFPIDRRGNTPFNYFQAPADTVKLAAQGFLPAFRGMVGDQKLWLALDTGSEVGLLQPKWKLPLQAHFIRMPQTSTLVTYSEKKEALRVYQMQHMGLGSWICAPNRFVFVSLRPLNRELVGRKIDGILGLAALGTDRLAINMRKREMYLWQPVQEQEAVLARSMYQANPSTNRSEYEAPVEQTLRSRQ